MEQQGVSVCADQQPPLDQLQPPLRHGWLWFDSTCSLHGVWLVDPEAEAKTETETQTSAMQEDMNPQSLAHSCQGQTSVP